MEYRVKYTLQKEVSVIIDIDDSELNEAFSQLGEINSDKDFNGSDDPRWGIEQVAYEAYSSCNETVEYGDFETIVDRSIEKLN